MKTNYFFIAFIFIFWIAKGQTSTTHYKVDFTQQAQNIVKVEAEFTVPASGMISIFTRGASPELKEGEATFVKNLAVNTLDNKSVAIKYDGEGIWKASKAAKQRVKISYQLSLKHEKHKWDNAGVPDEVFYRTPEGLFFSGYTLFLFPEEENLADVKNVSVEFFIA